MLLREVNTGTPGELEAQSMEELFLLVNLLARVKLYKLSSC